MKKIIALAGSDWKQIQKDPILIIAMLSPILLAIFLRLILPLVTDQLLNFGLIDLSNHYDLIISIGVLMTPIMMGFLVGFIILDERDEELLLFFSVTPLTKTGYVYYRLVSPLLFTFVLSYVVMYVQGLVAFDPITFFPIAIINALEASLFAMAMAILATNKVEGMALSKVLNLTLFAPILPYVINHPGMIVLGIIPTYWPVMAFLNSNNGVSSFTFYIIGGLIVHLVWIIWMTKRFGNRIG